MSNALTIGPDTPIMFAGTVNQLVDDFLLPEQFPVEWNEEDLGLVIALIEDALRDPHGTLAVYRDYEQAERLFEDWVEEGLVYRDEGYSVATPYALWRVTKERVEEINREFESEETEE